MRRPRTAASSSTSRRLRRSGDNTDADYFAEALPRYLEQQFGPGHSVAARIDSVYYGGPGSAGGSNDNRAVDTIEGVGRVDGREDPDSEFAADLRVFPRHRRLCRAPASGPAGAELRAMAGAAIGSRALTLHALVIGSGRIGHEINVFGVVEALGATFEVRRVAPRYLYGRLAPYGPVDPLDVAVLAGPPPDIVIASGRVTVPYMRAWKRAHGEVFAVFVQDPRYARGEFDLIWTPEHDGVRGPNIITTLTSPHPFSPARLAAARAAPDPRIARLPSAALRRIARRRERLAAFHGRRPRAARRRSASHPRSGL